jgi:acyl-CoA reductase-like NAD-dependent aldehyde dehydrogenase
VTSSIVLRNPATEAVLRELSLAGRDEVDAAVARAKAAGPAWRAVAPADRARLMRRFADTVAAHADELAALETANMGMPMGNSLWCANAVADVLHKSIDTAIQLMGARGYSKDTPLEWMYRYARQARLVDGASEVHKMVLARFLANEGTEFWGWR